MPNETMPPSNRRRDIRRATRSWAKATCRKGTLDLGGDIAMRVLDLGETGVRLVVGQQIETGQEVAVTLDAPNNIKPMRIVGDVVWSLETAERQFCVGVQFRKRIAFKDVMRLT